MLFALACGATLAISAGSRAPATGYEAAVFGLAAAVSLRARASSRRWHAAPVWLVLIGVWGLAQLALGATVYRWATWQASLQFAAFGATALVAGVACRDRALRGGLLRAMEWFGTAVAAVAVLAYATSPGRILWIFPAAYPDNWGPFPSRNNFAQFLELCFPVGLAEMARSRKWTAALAPALMLAAGLASASRAGAVLLGAEAVAGAMLLRRRLRNWLVLAAAAAVLAGLAGAGTLWGRLTDPDPLQYRREIFGSAARMIAAHPWSGYGLGTFAAVYPEFASFDSGASVEHAHNDWLEWAAEGGLPFAGLWLALAIGVAPRAVRSVWGMGVLAILLHAMVDYPFARLGVAAWAFILIGALGSEREVARRSY